MRFDVFVCLSARHLDVFMRGLDRLRTNLRPGRIVVAGEASLTDRLPDGEGLVFLDEDELLPGLSLAGVKERLKGVCGQDGRAGWYFQQFLKMAYALRCADSHYLIWDADTVPLVPLDFFTADGACLLSLTMEKYHKPYFENMGRLFPGELWKKIGRSFVAEHMLIECCWMRRLISRLGGENFFHERVLSVLGPEDAGGSGFSEFETYGNFMLTHCPERVAFRKLYNLREGGSCFCGFPDDATLDWLAQSFDTVSFESWSRSVVDLSRIDALPEKPLFENFFRLRGLQARSRNAEDPLFQYDCDALARWRSPHSNRELFSQIYADHVWGGEREGFYSGEGSHKENLVSGYIDLLRAFIRSKKIGRVIDIGCGDFNIMRKVLDESTEYVGLDVAEPLVDFNNRRWGTARRSFMLADAADAACRLPAGDLLIIRQVLQHLDNASILRVLEKARGFKHVLITEHVSSAAQAVPNIDMPTGSRIRLGLNSGVFVEELPFYFPVTAELLRIEHSRHSVLRTTWTRNF